MKYIPYTIIIIGLLTFSVSSTMGDDGSKKAEKVSDAVIDLAVPDSPAFAVLGLTPNDVSRPSSPREFGASLLNGVDANGNFQTGIALETSPFLLFKGDEITLEDYKRRYSTQFWSRTQLSFATAKGASDDDDALRMALGLRFTFYDDGDPRLDNDFVACIKKAVEEVEISNQLELEKVLDERNSKEKLIILKNAQLEEEQHEIMKKTLQEEIKALSREIDKLNERAEELRNIGAQELNKKSQKKIEECRENKKFISNLWNQSSWTAGIAPTLSTATGETEDFDYSGIAAWTSFAYRLGAHSQLILHTSYITEELVPDSENEGSYFEQDRFLAGCRFRVGNPNFHFNLETSYVYLDRRDGENDEVFRYKAGTEFRVAKDFWLNFSIGGEDGNSNSDEELFVLSSLKWAFSPEPVQKF